MKLKDHVAIVTGAAMGIGKSIAEAMAKEGAKIIVADILEKEGNAVAENINKRGGQAISVPVDVANYSQIKNTTEYILKQYGKIDILINNAGIGILEQFIDGKEEDWDRIIVVNLKGPLLFSRAVLPAMAERQYGKIINISSIAGLIAVERQVLYCVTKAGLISFTKSLAQETAQYHINVNAICPGLTSTPLIEQGFKELPDYFNNLLSGIPWGRTARPEEIAKIAVFLSSSDSEFITGQCIIIDGGSSKV